MRAREVVRRYLSRVIGSELSSMCERSFSGGCCIDGLGCVEVNWWVGGSWIVRVGAHEFRSRGGSVVKLAAGEADPVWGAAALPPTLT